MNRSRGLIGRGVVALATDYQADSDRRSWTAPLDLFGVMELL